VPAIKKFQVVTFCSLSPDMPLTISGAEILTNETPSSPAIALASSVCSAHMHAHSSTEGVLQSVSVSTNMPYNACSTSVDSNVHMYTIPQASVDCIASRAHQKHLSVICTIHCEHAIILLLLLYNMTQCTHTTYLAAARRAM
jgi:hypothetical protein